jgi:filamentous hemagglutinin family protein
MQNHHSGCLARKLMLAGVASTVCSFSLPTTSLAQNTIVPDTTLGNEASQVVPFAPNPAIDLIQGGAERGQNLFHSFEAFSVGNGNGAYFVTPNGEIGHVFSRVTGANPSNILGVLGVVQASGVGLIETDAALVLINPNGILFGENASLDLNGSFTATTASGVQFGNIGSFSTVDPQAPSSLLTIAPSAYFFNQLNGTATATASIQVSGADLQVLDGENLTLLGGNLAINDSFLFTPGGRIELGGLSNAGIISLNADGSLSFPDTAPRADVAITNQSAVSSSAPDGGAISIQANEIELIESRLSIFISGETGFDDAQAGNLSIQATGNVSVNNGNVLNSVVEGAEGNGGNVFLSANNLEVVNTSQITTSTSGVGNAGSITLEISGTAKLDNILVQSSVFSEAIGNGGNVNVSANNLEVINNAVLGTFSEGFGDSGNIVLSILETVRLDGDRTSANGLRTSIYSNLSPGGVGAGGNIDLFATNLEITNGAQIFTLTGGNGNAGNINLDISEIVLIDGFLTFDEELSSNIASDVFFGAMGNGGNIDITATNLQVANGARISTSTFGMGDAGNIILNVSDSARFEGATPVNGTASGVFSLIGPEGIGNGGNIEITTTTLEVLNDAELAALVAGTGEAGDIILTVADIARFDDFGRASSQIQGRGDKAGGDVQITTTTLEVLNGSQLTASTFGEGDAGDVVLEVAGTARFDGSIPSGEGIPSGAFSDVGEQAIGNGGNVEITASNIEITNGAQITAATLGIGDAGNVVLRIAETAQLDGVDPFGGDGASGISGGVGPASLGSGGNVELTATNLEVTNGAVITTSTFGNGNAGNTILSIAETARFDGVNPFGGSSASGAFSGVEPGGIGNGGNLILEANNLEIFNGALLAASTNGEGNAGNVIITITETARFDGVNPFRVDSSSGVSSDVNFEAVGDGGSVMITARNLDVTNGAQIGSSVFGQGSAGNVMIDIAETARFEGAFERATVLGGSGAFSSIEPGSSGSGGNLQINATNLVVTDGASLSAATFGEGDAGNVILNIADTAVFDGINLFGGTTLDGQIAASGAFSSANLGATGDGGDVQITASNLELTNGARLSAGAFNEDNAGDLLLNVSDQIYANDGTIRTNALAGSGGQIDITAGNILLEGDSDIQTFVLSGAGGGGNITITTDLLIALNDSDILAFADDGAGGNITLQTPAFFGENFTLDSLNADPATLDGNNRVDINATGAVSGLVSIPDVSFVENSLNDLTENIVATDQVLVGSCITRAGDDQGTFVNIGSGGLPTRPGDTVVSNYDTGEVQPLNDSVSQTGWQPGDPITEPTGAFALADGRLILSRECN